MYDGPENHTTITEWSLSISGFAAAIKGVSGQITGTSFWGRGELGGSAGLAAGGGAGIAGMITYSRYQGRGNVLPEKIRNLIEEFKKGPCNDK